MNISVRELRIEDAGDLAAAINNKKVLDNLRDGIPFPYTVKDAEEFINASLNAKIDSQYAFAITLNGKVIGNISVFRKKNIHNRSAEMGYYIAETYWGKGITSAAVRKVCEYIFACTDIIRVFALPFADNIASCRALEKAGFLYEGTLRSNAVKNARITDMKMYARIKE